MAENVVTDRAPYSSHGILEDSLQLMLLERANVSPKVLELIHPTATHIARIPPDQGQ